ncbi:YaaA family protein [Stackebrandtia soli]|uniref:YaaA family protein n=1 Tax=Stackebrandtia soli TaxID=1892856 RepID=UPI0039E89B74
MLILLPPSEGKTAPDDGPPIDWARLSLPQLNPTRERVLGSLARLCAGDADHAADVLKLGPTQRADLARNVALRSAATAPAASVYTGVLYDALAINTMDETVRRRCDERVLIFSGLWGAVRPDDPIPAYRCSANVKLPHLADDRSIVAATHWRAPLRTVLDPIGQGEFVVDLRSGPYRSMWRPSGKSATIRVLSERVDAGVVKRTIVSHFNKATKGRLCADLLRADVDCGDRSGLASALIDLGYRVEESGTDQLDIVIDG